MEFGKIIWSIFLTFLIFGVFASAYQTDKTSVNFSYSGDYLNMEYSFNNPIIENEGDKLFFNIDGLNSFFAPFEPILSFREARILIPGGRSVEDVEINYLDKKVIGVGNPVLAGEPVPMSLAEESFSEKDVQVDLSGIYPKNLNNWQVGEMMGENLLSILLYPIQYNSGTKEFYFYQSIEVVVKLKSNERSIYSTSSTRNSVKKIRNEVLEFVDNPSIKSERESVYATTSFSPTDVLTYDYIVITNDALKNCPVSYNFQDLLNQKANRASGQNLTSIVFTIEEILANSSFYCEGEYGDGCFINSTGYNIFNDTAARIRNFIKFAFENWNTEYVLLGGDVSIIPARSFWVGAGSYSAHIPSDMYYANLNGSMNADNDSYWGEEFGDGTDIDSDVYVGRAPVESCAELSNFIRKTILYENLTNDRNSYIKNVYNAYDSTTSNLLTPKNYLTAFSYLVNMNAFSSNSAMPTYLNTSENLPAIINHAGHGSRDYLSGYGSFSNTNNSYPNFFYSQACLVGQFDASGDSFAEKLVYAENSSYASLMNSRYGWYMPGMPSSGPGNSFMNEFWNQVLYKDVRNIGKANQLSKRNKFYYYGDYSRWLYWTQNLFGDPEILIYPSSYYWSIDLVFISPANKHYNNNTILVNGSSGETICDSCSIWWSNGSINNTTFEYFEFSEGNNTIYLYANDSSGNINSTSISFFVDMLDPFLVYNHTNGSFARQSEVYFNFSFDANNGTLDYEFVESDISGEFVNYTKAKNTSGISTTEDGLVYDVLISNSSNFSYRFCGVDLAGNMNCTNFSFQNIINTAPQFNSQNSSYNLSVRGNLTLNLPDYFSDVDPQDLSFNVSSDENVSYSLSNDSIIIGSLNDNVTNGFVNLSCYDGQNYSYGIINFNINKPELRGFGSGTTNISNLSSLYNVPLVLEKSDKEKILFDSVDINFPEIEFGKDVNISTNKVFINSTKLPSLNSSANISLVLDNDLRKFCDGSYSGRYYPVAYKDGVVCSDCVFIGCNVDGGAYVFRVGGFSEYEIRAATCSDGKQNQNEEGIDCGGVCSACKTSSGGSSSGGGGGSALVEKNKTYFISEDVVISGRLENLSIGDKLVIGMGLINYSIDFLKIENNSAYFKIESEVVEMSFLGHNDIIVNLTDSYYLNLSLNNFSKNGVLFFARVFEKPEDVIDNDCSDSYVESTISEIYGFFILKLVNIHYLELLFLVIFIYAVWSFIKEHRKRKFLKKHKK